MKSFAFSCFFCLLMAAAYAQCGQKIEVLSADEEANVEIRVTANSSFTATILLDGTTEKKPVETFSGQGVQSFSFTLPEKTATYYIDVKFANEEKFLCKRKTKILDLTAEK